MQAEAVRDPHLVRAKASLQQAALEEQQYWQALADLLVAYYTTVAMALIMLMVEVEAAALITSAVVKVVHQVAVAVLDLLVPVQ
jgi:hypothetical protein